MKTMKSYRETFETASQEALGICRRYAAKEPHIGQMADEFEQFARERLADLTPKIMIYGIYNSGKSTLLNALLGEERAKMNDIPTTVKIDQYKWKEYTIYDTPGIDAPEKDEAVSKEQLRKSDVIIFVMGTEGNVDYAKNYKELADIMESGKRILLVLNNKSGEICTSSDAEDIKHFAEFKQRVYLNFTMACGKGTSEELARRFPMCIVDAKLALEARTRKNLTEEDRNAMLEASNIGELEESIVAEYRRANGDTIIRGLQHELIGKLEKVQILLENTIQNVTSRKGSKDIAEIQSLQDEMVEKIRHLAIQKERQLEDEIYAIFDNIKQSEDEVREKLQKLNENFANEINEEMKRQLERLAQRVSGITTDFAAITPNNLEITNIPKPDIETSAETASSASPSSSGVGTGTKLAAAGMATMAAAKIIPMLVAIPVAGPILATIGGLLLGLGGLFGMKGGNSAANQEYERIHAEAERQKAIENEKARLRQERRDLSRRLSRDMVEAILHEIENHVISVMKPCIEAIRDVCQQADEASFTAHEDLRQLREILEILRTNLEEA